MRCRLGPRGRWGAQFIVWRCNLTEKDRLNELTNRRRVADKNGYIAMTDLGESWQPLHYQKESMNDLSLFGPATAHILMMTWNQTSSEHLFAQSF